MNEIITTNGSIQPAGFNMDLMQRFIEFTDVKETTLQGYKVCLRQFILWLQENNIRQPQREDIKKYKEYLNAQDFTAGTKQQYLRAVKHLFRWAASEGLYNDISANIKGWKTRTDNTKREAFLSEDIKAVLDSIDRSTQTGKRDYFMILLSVTAGLRIIEMQRANIGDIQTIKRQKVLYIQGKGHSDKDDYKKLTPEVVEAMEAYLNTLPHSGKNDPLFIGTSNRAKYERLTEPSISRIIKDRFKKAGFDCDKLTAHSLRHTSITLYIEGGADLMQAQQHARHRDPVTTEIYIHRLDKEKSNPEQKIYDMIFKPGEKTYKEKIVALLDDLTEADQAQALEYLQKLAGKQATA